MQRTGDESEVTLSVLDPGFRTVRPFILLYFKNSESLPTQPRA